MRMFGILSVERAAPHGVVRNTVHGTDNVESRFELFRNLKEALGPEWQDAMIVKFFYAEEDQP